MTSRRVLVVLAALVLPLVGFPATPASAATVTCGSWANFTTDGTGGARAYTRVRSCVEREGSVVTAAPEAQTRDSHMGRTYDSYSLRVTLLQGGLVVARKTCNLTTAANTGQQNADGSQYSYGNKMRCKIFHSGVRGKSYEVRTVLVYNLNNDGRGDQTRTGIAHARLSYA